MSISTLPHFQGATALKILQIWGRIEELGVFFCLLGLNAPTLLVEDEHENKIHAGQKWSSSVTSKPGRELRQQEKPKLQRISLISFGLREGPVFKTFIHHQNQKQSQENDNFPWFFLLFLIPNFLELGWDSQMPDLKLQHHSHLCICLLYSDMLSGRMDLRNLM